MSNHMVDIPNSPLVNRFPFPFKEDSYRYSNNSETLASSPAITITPEYYEEIQLKRRILSQTPERAFQSFSHSINAQWEILELVVNQLTAHYPDYFHVAKKEDTWTFHNYLLQEKEVFRFGDASTLPYEPLDFIGRHVQEDLIYISQKDSDLFMDAGQLCFPANWSIHFNLGMSYLEFHSPVPVFSDSGLAEKVRSFLMRMEAGKPWTRLNWTLTVEPILDTFPETFSDWGSKKEAVTAETAGELVYLRTEDQRLFRLPESNGLLFSIHSHLISLNALLEKPEWTERFYRVLSDLPDYIAEYKGFISYKGSLLAFLEKHLSIQEEAIK
ncbi:DUF3445 domain-containing protein [Domibacillus sp. DTU_2020_1001157_1_SI_ALB_TIR_016]|uniref:heme-dependent oxidative N-demethylase family protein n=1 Tax=Domibacillus sp. DTU_2020_1001157_1_SI_ALB_TIR_016 TaxID=3077789 RepID=UPI0028E95E26|nr:DUF3445 domain-containing protein [Domibacillus sp. DTU_2020_1001157_1_SI_ALB_TIR_016]WNS78041.1 DUF3445 domain-containing protein [Domibacillus sp. DTU_2020_1001157_1_SI_ALB_TIR_016]